MKEKIKRMFDQVKIDISDEQAEKLFMFYQILMRENEKYNLTAIKDFEDVVKKHFIDSAIALPYFHGKVLDVGSGAGFPGIVLAILNEKLQLTLLDSLNKRVNFLNMVKEELEINNITAIHSRVEDFKQKNFFDCVTARAVAELPTLLEYLLPFVKIGGRAVIYKGSNCFDEVEKSSEALKILGGQIEEMANYSLFDNTRTLVIVKKMFSSPNNFPRGKNLPRKKPL